jgi:hypothetical protein
MSDVPADHQTECCSYKDVGGEVSPHSYARGGNQARKAVSDGRDPTFSPVSLGNDGGQGEGCGGMTRWERGPAGEECPISIVIADIPARKCGPGALRGDLRKLDDHQTVADGLETQQACGFSVLFSPTSAG